MKRVIVRVVKELKDEKKKGKRFPCVPNEREVQRRIFEQYENYLEELINEDKIKVVGEALNKLKMLDV